MTNRIHVVTKSGREIISFYPEALGAIRDFPLSLFRAVASVLVVNGEVVLVLGESCDNGD